MKITKKQTQNIADSYLTPLLSLVDTVLAGPEFLKTAEASLEKMGENLSTCQAVSGIMLDMDDVDKRAIEFETYKAAIKLLQVRQKQQLATIELHAKNQGMRQLKNAMGF